jgi:hypothetical protein
VLAEERTVGAVVGPECIVAQDADDLIRLLAIFGRRNCEA